MSQTTTITWFDTMPPAPPKPAARRVIIGRSKYDSTSTVPENKNHWSRADSLSASASQDPATRAKMRDRSRHEDSNSPNFQALIDTRANCTVGTGPRLQVRIPGRSAEDARAVELAWARYAKRIKLFDALHLFDLSETREGELFGLKVSDHTAPPGEPQLYLKLIESDQCCTPDLDPTDPAAVDGIRLDTLGRPVEYHFLRNHPGDRFNMFRGGPLEYDHYPARQVIHFFTRRRVGQCRGIPSLQASLNHQSILRRFTIASLSSAETQARISAVIKRPEEVPGLDDDPEETVDERDLEVLQVGQTSFMVLPAGDEANSFAPAHPGPNFKQFKDVMIQEGGRPISAPRNISTGSSAEYNFSSAKMDLGLWNGATTIRRVREQNIVCDDMLDSWFDEGRLIPGYLPVNLPPLSEWVIEWRWPAYTSLDAEKDAKAATLEIANGTTTLDRICGEQGGDWEEILEQRAAEMKRCKELGLPIPGRAAPAESPSPRPNPDDDAEIDTDLEDSLDTETEEPARV